MPDGLLRREDTEQDSVGSRLDSNVRGIRDGAQDRHRGWRGSLQGAARLDLTNEADGPVGVVIQHSDEDMAAVMGTEFVIEDVRVALGGRRVLHQVVRVPLYRPRSVLVESVGK